MADGKPMRYTASYKCDGNVTNLKIRIRIREGDPEDIKANLEDGWRSKVFSWQEKHFSKIEREFYGDVNNCLSDSEKIYNERIIAGSNEDETAGFTLFTYVNGDGYVAGHEVLSDSKSKLQKCMDNSGSNLESELKGTEFDYEKFLNKSMLNPLLETDFETMHILADFGEYLEDVWMGNEKLLCSMKFDKTSRMLSIYPDFTTTQPYSMKIHGETVRHIFYYLENGTEPCADNVASKENDRIRKVMDLRQSRISKLIVDQFFIPAKNKMFVYVFFEILSGRGFENDDLFVKYTADLPDDWSCDNEEMLKGTTQRCHTNPEDYSSHFGHCFELILQYDIQNLQENYNPDNPRIYFEIISKGTWERYTTEGLTNIIIPVSKPGYYYKKLSCFRFDTRGPSGGLRRFFIGDYPNYDNIKWIGPPKRNLQERFVNKFNVNTVGTGQLDVRFNIIYQSQAFLHKFSEKDHKEKLIYDKLNSSSLIRSVNQVLLAFKKAKKNLADVKKDVIKKDK